MDQRVPYFCGVRGVRAPHPLLAVAILLGMTVLAVTAMSERASVGWVQTLHLYDVAYFIFREQVVLQVVWWVAFGLHCVEPMYAVHVARNRARLGWDGVAVWAVLCFLFGAGSLSSLLRIAKHAERARS